MELKLEINRSEYRSEFIHIPEAKLDRDKFLAIFGPIVADMEKEKSKEERLTDFVGEDAPFIPMTKSASPIKIKSPPQARMPRRFMTPQRIKKLKGIVKNYIGAGHNIEEKDKAAHKEGYKNWASMYAIIKKYR